MELIRVVNLYKTYHLGEVDVPVLRGVSLTIHRGEMVALMGASGSGKTTLMNILGCLDRPSSGEYWLDGEEMSHLTPNQRALVRTEKLGFVFQSFNLLPRTSALYNVLMPLDYSPRHCPATEASKLSQSLLDRVGLAERVDHEPSQMSGGQQQRVAIARSLVNHPALLLADEPTGNLDSHTSVEILRMFQQLNAEGITVVLVTHDPSVAAYASRTIHIVDGLIEGDEINPSPTDLNAVLAGAHTSSDAGSNASSPTASPVVASTSDASPPAVASSTSDASSSASGEAVTTNPSKPKKARGKKPPVVKGSLLPATWRTALGALRRNKMRSALSALGVIIAVAAVIAMTEIGQGSKATLQKSIASMGANTLLVMGGSMVNAGVNLGTGSVITLKPQDAEEIARQCPAVASVAITARARSQIVYKNRNCVPNQIIGTSPSYLVVRDWGEMDEGEMFSDQDVRACAKVCVVGTSIKRDLFQGQSPVGKEIRLNNVPFRVLGVLGRKGANMMGMDQDDVVLAPWTTIKFRVSGSSLTNTNQSSSASSSSSSTSDTVNSISDLYTTATDIYLSRTSIEKADTPQLVRFISVDVIQVKAKSSGEIQEAIQQITALLRDRHHLREGAPDDFTIRDMTEMTNMMSSTSQTMSTLLLVVAMISLLVGGVGIMNIMLVSVTERTREIGLRMAVGARSHHILRQFLVEAIVLCLVGGVIGILLGRGMSLLVRYFMNWPTMLSMPAIIAAVVVSVGIGVIFGFYPAWKASRLDPIEALRYE
jgi:macrolide transport system ATP-binding/permease protein